MSTAFQYGLQLGHTSTKGSCSSFVHALVYRPPIYLASISAASSKTNFPSRRHYNRPAHLPSTTSAARSITFPTHHATHFIQSIRLQSTATATRIIHNDAINPPSSTLSAPLALPERQPDQSVLSYYFSLGRAYLSFYKIGAKAVYSNFQLSRKVQSRIPSSTTLSEAVATGLLSRGDWQLIRRSRRDIKKVPLFAIVFMICGEFTPIVVILMPGVVPGTCMIPKQVLSLRRNAEKRRAGSFRDGTISSPNELQSSGKMEVEDLKPAHLTHAGRSLGLYPTFLDRLGLGMPSALLRRRVREWKEYIDLDDKAIERNGGVGQLEVEELRIACEERGLDVLEKSDEQLSRVLREWLQARKTTPVTKLVLTRPNVWGKGI